MRIHGVICGLLAACCFIGAAAAQTALRSPQRTLQQSAPRLAIGGHDPVSYFTERKAMRGSPDFVFVWDDARYHFASAANRDLFMADPERYAPQYTGYCASAIAVRSKSEPNPQNWVIYDGRLFVFATVKGGNGFAGPKGGELIRQADRNWAILRQ